MKTSILTVLSLCYQIASAQYTKLMDFAGGANGESPFKTSLVYDGTFLYGVTEFGGQNNAGIVFKIKPNGSAFTNLYDFAEGSLGVFPVGSLTKIGDTLYGISSMGGPNNLGAVFKLNKNGSGHTNLHSFVGTDGGLSQGTLVYDGTYLYGSTTYSGNANSGVIFKIKPNGSSFSNVVMFDFLSTGSTPGSSLCYDGTFLYGMTMGTYTLGNVFKVKPDGTAFSRLGPNDGGNAQGGLVFDGTYFIGMTPYSGANNKGKIFRMKSDGSAYSILHDFSGVADGEEPWNDLLRVGNDLYGMTSRGGMYDLGVLFTMKTDGSGFTKLVDFDGTSNGSHPHGSLVSDGIYIYGMTTDGGAYDKGTIFRYVIDPVLAGINESKESASVEIFPNPCSDQLNLRSSLDLSNATITLLDPLGRVLPVVQTTDGQTTKLSLGELSNGIYFIQIRLDEKVILNKKITVTDR